MKKLVLVIAILMTAIVSACTDETQARRVLDNYGFTDVQITGYVPMACSDDDFTHTGFRAKNIKGQPVEGVVCCGGFKACTVRW